MSKLAQQILESKRQMVVDETSELISEAKQSRSARIQKHIQAPHAYQSLIIELLSQEGIVDEVTFVWRETSSLIEFVNPFGPGVRKREIIAHGRKIRKAALAYQETTGNVIQLHYAVPYDLRVELITYLKDKHQWQEVRIEDQMYHGTTVILTLPAKLADQQDT